MQPVHLINSKSKFSFWFIIIMGWCEWHFCDQCFKFLIADFQIDFNSIGLELFLNISHGHITAETWTWTAAGNFTNLLIAVVNLNAVSSWWPLFQTNTNTTTYTTVFQLIQNYRCARKVCFSSTTFCFKREKFIVWKLKFVARLSFIFFFSIEMLTNKPSQTSLDRSCCLINIITIQT